MSEKGAIIKNSVLPKRLGLYLPSAPRFFTMPFLAVGLILIEK